MADPINPNAQWPGDNMDPDAIEQAAGQINTVGSNVSATGGNVAKAWSGLSKGYHAPEQETLFGAMKPAQQAATDFGTDMGKVQTALTTFAGEVRTIKKNVAAIRASAQKFVAGIHDGKVTITQHVVENRAQLEMGESTTTTHEVDWNSDDATVQQNNALIRKVNDQQEQLWAAERTCANAIRDVYGAPHIFAASQSNPHGYGVDQIPDNASNLPWGNTVDVKESCGDKVADGVFVDGIVNGLGGLIGFHYTQESATSAEHAGFSWSTLGNTWKGLGELGTGIATGPFTPALAELPGPVGKWFNASTETTEGFVPGLLGINVFNHDPNKMWYQDFSKDPFANWTDNPARTAGSVGFNVLTFAVPGPKGLGALTKGGKAAAVADKAGDVSDASRAAEGLGDLSKVSGDAGDLAKTAAPADTTALGDLGKTTGDLGDGLNGLGKTDINIPSVSHDGVTIDHPNIGDHAVGDHAVGDHGANAPEPRDPGTAPEHQPSPHADQPSGAGTHTPDGTQPSPNHHGTPYDPHTKAPETVPAKEAPSHYTPHDVQKALDDAPVNEHGEPVDPRTGEPLLLHRSDGMRGWEMRWDPDHNEWVAQNHGTGYASGLPAHGDPGSFGYDAQGERMPYVNSRPPYAPGQVDAVWRAADTDGDGVVTVLNKDDVPVQIHWDGTSSRDGVWDMGHVPGGEYAKLRHEYLNHEISYKEFMERYQDPGNYEVQEWERNRAHLDEVP